MNKVSRPVYQLVRHDVGNIVGGLNAALHHQDTRTHHDWPKAFEHVRPDNQIGDAGLVLNGDETDPAGRTRALTHQYDTCRLNPCTIWQMARLLR